MTTRAEAWAIVMNDLSERKEAGPSDVVEAMYEDEDGGNDDKSKPEGKVVYQRVV
jgi:hypothetical protein